MADELIINGAVAPSVNGSRGNAELILNGIDGERGDFYVSPNGDDSDGLTKATAKNAINDGLALADAVGKSVLVAKGTYNEYVLMGWPIAHATTLIGASNWGVGQEVLINGQDRALRIDRDNTVISNLTLNATADDTLQMIQQNTTLNNVTFKAGSNKIFIQDTDNTSTTTFNSCDFRNTGEATAFQITALQEGDIVFNDCYFKSLPSNFVLGSGTYTLNNCFIMMDNDFFMRISGGTSNVVFNDCYLLGVKGISYDYLDNTEEGNATLTLNRCFYQRVPNFSGDYDIDSTSTINNSWSDTLGLLSRRRPVSVSLGVDDTQYYDGFEALVTEADARGVPSSWHISPAEMTSQNWIDANAAILDGHEIYSHGNVYTDYMGDLLAFTVEFTGAGAATVEIASDTLILKEAGVPVKTIDLTIDTAEDTMTDINATADWTSAMVSATRHADNPATQLADIGVTDATSEVTLSLDSTYYAWVAVQSKANIEANLLNYTCDVFIYPQHGKSEDAITALQDASFVGAGGVLGAADWLFDTADLDLYNISRAYVGDLDFTSTATLKRDVSAIVETAGYYGGAIQFYSHGLGETTQSEWGQLIDAIQDLNVPITTYRDGIQYIRNTATITDNRAANFTFYDDNWLPSR